MLRLLFAGWLVILATIYHWLLSARVKSVRIFAVSSVRGAETSVLESYARPLLPSLGAF